MKKTETIKKIIAEKREQAGQSLKDAVAEKKAGETVHRITVDKAVLGDLEAALAEPLPPEAHKSPPAASKPEPGPKAPKPEKKPQPAPGTSKKSKTRRNCCTTKRGQDVPHLPDCPTLRPVGAKTVNLSAKICHETDV